MSRSFQAIYENGALYPVESINLPEKKVLTVTIAEVDQIPNSTPLQPVSEEEFERLLEELASGPAIPPIPPDFSRKDIYTDHD